MNNKKKEQFSYGGQAVIEGVMMRGARQAAIAVRDPGGDIQLREVPLNATLYRGWVSKTPFLRGLIGLWDALGLGTKALMWSADVALTDGLYYRLDYQGRTGWVMHMPARMRVEGSLDSVVVVDDEKGAVDPIPRATLLVFEGKTVDVLAEPKMDAKSVGKIKSGQYPILARKLPETKKPSAAAMTALLLLSTSLEESTVVQKTEKETNDFFSGATATGLILVSLTMGVGLFIGLPAFISGTIENVFEVNRVTVEAIEGTVKLALFLGYIAAIGQLEDVKRLFQYHGAEHKTINAYEAGVELTPKKVQEFPLEHPRCGTAFLLNVIIISILVHLFIGRPNTDSAVLNLVLLVLSRVGVIPVIAGIAYELLRFTAKHINNPVVRLMIKPNLALQKMTTRQPDDDMVEVAIQALNSVLQAEGLPQHGQRVAVDG
jgi:uncharacterized protein YqhQ